MSEKTIEELREEAERAELEKRINDANTPNKAQSSDKSGGIALILLLLFGWLGAHWFYMGRSGVGLLYLLSWPAALLYLVLPPAFFFFLIPIIGCFIDFFRFIFGGIFIDGNGNQIKLY